MFEKRTTQFAVVASTATLLVGGAFAVASPAPTTPSSDDGHAHTHAAAEADGHQHALEEPEPDNTPFEGAASTKAVVKAVAAVRGNALARSTGPAKQVGVATYRSKTNLLCFVAGPVSGGAVGQIGKGGFKALDPADAPGLCGDFDSNVEDFGGIALGAGSASAEDPTKVQSIAYGTVQKADTKVTVTFPDGTSATPEIQTATGLGKAKGTYSAALPLGADITGTAVTLTSASGLVLHTFVL